MLYPAPGEEQLQAAGIWKAALQSDPSGPGGEGESHPATPCSKASRPCAMLGSAHQQAKEGDLLKLCHYIKI